MTFIFPFPSWVWGAKPECDCSEFTEKHDTGEDTFLLCLALIILSQALTNIL